MLGASWQSGVFWWISGDIMSCEGYNHHDHQLGPKACWITAKCIDKIRDRTVLEELSNYGMYRQAGWGQIDWPAVPSEVSWFIFPVGI